MPGPGTKLAQAGLGVSQTGRGVGEQEQLPLEEIRGAASIREHPEGSSYPVTSPELAANQEFASLCWHVPIRTSPGQEFPDPFLEISFQFPLPLTNWNILCVSEEVTTLIPGLGMEA